jgi:hypothetical protein
LPSSREHSGICLTSGVGQLDLGTRKRGVKARNQLFIIEQLGLKPSAAGRQRFSADFYVRECRDEDIWQWAPLLSQSALQPKAVTLGIWTQ